jgi:hypothetical protein
MPRNLADGHPNQVGLDAFRVNEVTRGRLKMRLNALILGRASGRDELPLIHIRPLLCANSLNP